MQSFTVEALPDAPIILVTLYEDFEVGEHIEKSDAATREILAASEQSYFNVLDTTRWKFNFDQLLQAASTGARGDDPIWKHPQIRQTVIVTNNRAIEMAAKGLKSATFGNIEIVIFKNVDEALTWCRNQVSIEG